MNDQHQGLTKELCPCCRIILRQCPFCGGDAEVGRWWFFGWNYGVECTECFASTDCFDSREEAASNWNYREPET